MYPLCNLETAQYFSLPLAAMVLLERKVLAASPMCRVILKHNAHVQSQGNDIEVKSIQYMYML